MKMRRWPFWPVFAMGSLITLVVVMEVHSDTENRAPQCSSSSPICNAPTITFNKLFIP